jgi:hypothetical protein
MEVLQPLHGHRFQTGHGQPIAPYPWTAHIDHPWKGGNALSMDNGSWTLINPLP